MNSLVSTREAAQVLGVHRCTVQRYVQQGWLRKQKRNGRDNGYSANDLGEFQAKMRNGAFHSRTDRRAEA